MKKIYQDSTFYLVIFIISYFIYVYPFEILNGFLFKEKFSRSSSLYLTLIIGALIILYFRTKITFYPIKIFIYEGMGIGFISFWIVNIALIISFLFDIEPQIIGYTSFFIIIVLTIYSLINARYINIKNINLSSKKIKKNYKFIFISDIHLGSNSINHLKLILKKISNLDYDFLLIGGDLIDSSSFNLEKLSILNEIDKPIYFVTGNHEYYISNYKEKISSLNKFNLNILNNTNSIFEEINIIGIDDNIDNNKKNNFVNNFLDNSKLNLLLIHKPSLWNNVKDRIDLMFSGHTHNGQIFPFNFFVRLQFKQKYGLYSSDKSYLYVTSGAACWGPRMRLGTNNEIIYINLFNEN